MAQLNSALDYGSRGYRFESCRGHLKRKVCMRMQAFLFFRLSKAYAFVKNEKQKSTTLFNVVDFSFSERNSKGYLILLIKKGALSGSPQVLLFDRMPPHLLAPHYIRSSGSYIVIRSLSRSLKAKSLHENAGFFVFQAVKSLCFCKE